MIQVKNSDTKKLINRRLSRIEGQIRGVKKMVDEDRECKEILQQLIAIRAAVQSASLNFMQDIASDCLLTMGQEADPGSQRALLIEMIQMLAKLS